jgi:hypothetical protein
MQWHWGAIHTRFGAAFSRLSVGRLSQFVGHMHTNSLLWHCEWYAGIGYGSRCPRPKPRQYHDMPRPPAFAYLNDAPIYGHSDVCLACSKRVLGVAPLSLPPRHCNTHYSRLNPSTLVIAVCLDYLRLYTRTMHPSTALQTYLCAGSQRILVCGALGPCSQTRHTQHHNSGVLTPPRRTNYAPASPGDARRMEHTRMSITPSGTASNGYWVRHPAPRSQLQLPEAPETTLHTKRYTATPAARDPSTKHQHQQHPAHTGHQEHIIDYCPDALAEPLSPFIQVIHQLSPEVACASPGPLQPHDLAGFVRPARCCCATNEFGSPL